MRDNMARVNRGRQKDLSAPNPIFTAENLILNSSDDQAMMRVF